MTNHTGQNPDAVYHGDDTALCCELCELHDLHRPVADWRASATARDFPDEVAVQRALSAGARSTVAAQQVEAPTPISTKAKCPMTRPTSNIDATTPTATDPFSPARLRGHLDGLGLSRAEVAARIGRTEADLASYEDGAAQPPPQVLAALAAVLSITVDDLHQKRDDWAADYVDVVAVYCQPETDAELEAVAAALRRLDAVVDRHRRATAAAVAAAPDPEPARPATPALSSSPCGPTVPGEYGCRPAPRG